MTAIRAPSAPLTLVLGKGGVGRSTVARALTQAARDAGLRARCVELSGSGRARRSGAAADGQAGERVLRLDPAQALEDAAAPVFGSRALARAALGNFAIKRLHDVVPGSHEYALLLSAVDLVGADLAVPCDRVIVDMPATGHGLSWLGAAQRLARLVPKGRSREQADRLDATFAEALAEVGLRPSHYLLNRISAEVPSWASVLAASPQLAPELRDVVALAEAESKATVEAADRTAQMLSRLGAARALVAIPLMPAASPSSVVAAVASHLGHVMLTPARAS